MAGVRGRIKVQLLESLDGNKPTRSWHRGSSEARRGVKAEMDRGNGGAIWQRAGRRELLDATELEEIQGDCWQAGEA
jgi:hypothetical protein